MPATPEPGQPGMLTVAQVASELNISTRAVNRLCQYGDLPYVQVANQIRRIRATDLAAFVRARLRPAS